jgi:hypothetical protein
VRYRALEAKGRVIETFIFLNFTLVVMDCDQDEEDDAAQSARTRDCAFWRGMRRRARVVDRRQQPVHAIGLILSVFVDGAQHESQYRPLDMS